MVGAKVPNFSQVTQYWSIRSRSSSTSESQAETSTSITNSLNIFWLISTKLHHSTSHPPVSMDDRWDRVTQSIRCEKHTRYSTSCVPVYCSIGLERVLWKMSNFLTKGLLTLVNLQLKQNECICDTIYLVKRGRETIVEMSKKHVEFSKPTTEL